MKLIHFSKPRTVKTSEVWMWAVTLISLLLIAALVATNGYDIPRWTINSGGVSEGNGYRLSGTLGQAEVGPLLVGGSYSVKGGFWGSGQTEATMKYIYLPLIEKD